MAGPPGPGDRAAHRPAGRHRDRAGGPLPRLDRRAAPPQPPRSGEHAPPGAGPADPGRALRRTPRRRPDPQAREAEPSPQVPPAQAGPDAHPLHNAPDSSVAARRDDPDAGAPAGRRDGPALRRPAPARTRHRVAGVRLAATPGLQRRRPRRDAGDAGHRSLDEVVRRTPAAAPRHPRQRPRRDPDPAHPAELDEVRRQRDRRLLPGLGAVRRHGHFKDTKRYVASVRAHQRNLRRTGSPF